ncbi:MAG TPA: amino acid adenylation domain-containing protein, partial [Vicinamibacterales bacterium]|nr:amino acid adenylation domain-containing protein [Vicinamibacterales bacterium]
IYTSGSTGTPKGVLLEHRGLVNHHIAVAKAFGLSEADRVLQFALLGFDICLEELFPSWLTGAAVVFRTDTIAGREFLDWLDRRRITVMDVPTAFWHEWVHDLRSLNAKPPASLRLLIVGGERASRQVLTVWQAIVGPDVRWLNTYGPTEASVIATLHEPAYDPEGRDTSEIPLGKPIANVQVYVLDPQMQPVPVGVPGELYIGGAGLARGYLNRPEQTAERFIPSPFAASGLLYRTGDLAKYRHDGSIEFVGRSDDQVKIRGFRVEPGEVSAALSQQPGVFQSFVLATSGPQPRLVAYVVPERGRTVDQDALRAGLQQRFPMYMVPSAFVVVDELPLTPQGKVNRRALPIPEGATAPAASAPEAAHERAPLEAMLIDIWERVLEQRPIGRRDDFFDLGGHSLLAVRLLSQIRQRLGVDLPLATMFTARTVEALADELLRDEERRALSTLMPIQTEGSSSPLFCVSRPNVNALGYVFLSRHLGRDQPVYGLQSHLRDASREPYTQAEFEKTAADYIAAMRTVQPHGPYFLIGNCEGAHIAFEMCRQLHAQGEQIGMFAVLDAWPQENTRRLYLFLAHYYLRRFRLFVQSEDRGTFVRKRIGGFLKLLYQRVTLQSSAAPKPQSADAMRERYWPGTEYQLPTWRGDALLFRVKKQPYWRIRDYKMAWDRRVLGTVEVVEVSGEHTTILREPHVRTVARHVAAKIAAVASRDKRDVAADRTAEREAPRLRVPSAVRSPSIQPSSASSRRVLMMCYLYPPILTSGTMRSVAFSRNLPQFGWKPAVLSVADNRAGFPQTEPVPDDVEVHRVAEFNLNGVANLLQGLTNRLLRLFGGELKRTVYRDWLCVPDPHIGWFALPRAIRLARRADAIYTSCSPFSSAVMASFVKRITKKPLIVDFRDAWLLNPYNSPGPRTLRYIRSAEPRVIRLCDALILNTPGATELYKKTYPQWAHKMFCIPNGYDSLNPAPPRKQRAAMFRIMHVGSFYGSRNPDLLLEALAQIGNPSIQFVHVGAAWPDFKRYEGRVNISVFPSLPHHEALELMKDASLLYLKQGFEASVTHYIAVAAKTYEYLATGLPILADGPESDNVAIVRKYAATSYIVTSGEVGDLKRAILKALDEERAVIPMVSPEFVRDFDRVTLTGQLAEVLNASVQRQVGRAPQLEASYSTQTTA